MAERVFRHTVGANKNNVLSHNVENLVCQNKGKALTAVNRQPLQNRVALATISDQSNVLKPKLFEKHVNKGKDLLNKAGKGKSVTASFKKFTIYQDDENDVPNITHIENQLNIPSIRKDHVEVDEKESYEQTELDSTQSSIDNRLVLNSLVKRLPVAKQEADKDVSCISIDSLSEVETSKDSPMALDVSTVDDRIQELRELSKDYFLVPEYASEIYMYLREAEHKNRPKATYMKKQSDITEGMRGILVDWLVEVAEEYKLQTETLYLTVSYIDRFLSYMSVLRGKLQLVGAASMFIASKFEEIYPPEVGEFVYITDDTYTKKQVLKMEALVLRVLCFELVSPTVYCFLQRYCKVADLDEVTECLAMYIAELTLLDGETYLPFLASEIAASAVCLANHTMNRIPWSTQIEVSSGYSMQHFQSCMSEMYKSYCAAPHHPQQAIQEKYRSTKFHEVSQLNAPSSLPI